MKSIETLYTTYSLLESPIAIESIESFRTLYINLLERANWSANLLKC